MLHKTFRTNDSPPVVIHVGEGGEQIENNAYVLGIEFCTHDSPVLAFSHIPVMGSASTGGGWLLETRTGNRLAMVTGPAVLSHLSDAYAAKQRLTDSLARSMEVSPTTPQTVAALTLEDWRNGWARLQNGRQNGAVDGSTETAGPGDSALNQTDVGQNDANAARQVDATTAYCPWTCVSSRLTESNIAGGAHGVNIKAALLRMQNNRHNWDAYVGSTVLCRTEKDWGVRYQSCLTMPMTLSGFFLYLVLMKHPRAGQSLEELIESSGTSPEGDGAGTLDRRVTQWFWGSLTAGACSDYVERLIGQEHMAAAGIAGNVCDIHPDQITFSNLQFVAFLYLIATKALAGALCQLSEPVEDKLRRIAWKGRSTSGTAEESGNSYSELLAAHGVTSTEWAGYRDARKDLTGLWFQPTLLQVMACEGFAPAFCRRVAEALRDGSNGSIWQRTLKKHLLTLSDPQWDHLFQNPKGLDDDLRQHRWMALVEQIALVEAEIAGELDRFAEWRDRNPELEPFEYAYPLSAQLADVRNAFEARHDESVDAIPNEALDRWTYPVEHRFR